MRVLEQLDSSTSVTPVTRHSPSVYAAGSLQCAAKKVSPKVICHFLSNHLEFLREILHVYYLFIYT